MRWKKMATDKNYQNKFIIKYLEEKVALTCRVCGRTEKLHKGEWFKLKNNDINVDCVCQSDNPRFDKK